MNPNTYIGKSLKELSIRTGFHHDKWCIFILRDLQDTVGTRITDDYYLRTILHRYPGLGCAVVKIAEDYYGQIALRVLYPREKERKL